MLVFRYDELAQGLDPAARAIYDRAIYDRELMKSFQVVEQQQEAAAVAHCTERSEDLMRSVSAIAVASRQRGRDDVKVDLTCFANMVKVTETPARLILPHGFRRNT